MINLMQEFERFMEKRTSLVEYYEMLEKHDWYYMFSDDSTVYNKGHAARNSLNSIAAKGGQEYVDLLRAFSEHMFSGEPWKNERAPKPEKPTE